MEVVEELRKAGEDVSPWSSGCGYPHHHKNIALSPGFLGERGIPYQVITQPSGTLVYVGPSIPHQVLNTEVNLAEAVNVGGSAWNCFPISPRCVCTGSVVRELPRNDHFLNITRCTPLLRYDCPVEGCVSTAPSVSLARAHAARHASEGNKLSRYLP